MSHFTQNLSALSTSAPSPSTRADPSGSRRGTCDRGIWTKPLAFSADAEGYINIMVWGFNGRLAISSPSGPRSLPILLKREFKHRRILSPALELLHHPTQTAARRTRDSVRRASGFVQIAITRFDP